MSPARRALLFSLAQCALACAGAALLWRVSDWQPAVFLFLLAFGLVGDRLEVETRTLTVSGAFLALGLAMVLLGPVPAAALGLVITLADAAQRRPPTHYIVSNIATFIVFPLVGGTIVYLLADRTGLDPHDANYGFVVIGAFLFANALNFLQVAATRRLVEGAPIWQATRTIYLPIFPSQIVVGLLAAVLVYAHAH